MNPEILRVLILIAVFAAVLLTAEAAISWFRTSRGYFHSMNERVRLISRGVSREEVLVRLRRTSSAADLSLPAPLAGMARWLDETLAGAGLRISAGRVLLYLLLATILLFLVVVVLIYLSGSPINAGKLLLCASFAAALGFGLPLILLSRRADKRRRRLVEQFPVALDVFVRGLRAGHPVAAALELLTTEMPDPIGSEFGIALDEITYGADLRDALQNMADRCGIEDMQMFVVSLSVQGETGGNLAEILENLSSVIRERATLLIKVRALSSEGRMTGLILTALPILSFVGLFIVNPAFYLDVAEDPAFIPSFAVLLLGFAIGVYWIRRLVDLKV